MSGPVRAVVVQPRFMNQLFRIEQYIGREKAERGREFVDSLFNFLYDILATQPLAYPAYHLPRHPGLKLRRAIFRKRYLLLYEVTDAEILLLALFTADRNSDALDPFDERG